MKKGMSKRKIMAASVIGCILTLQLGALSVSLETLASGVTELPFGIFVGVMQPIHLAIGLVEGLITAAVLIFIYEARPEMLWQYESSGQTAAKIQETTALLPDYGFKTGESAAGTSFSGIIGAVVVIGLCVLCCYTLKLFKRKKQKEEAA